MIKNSIISTAKDAVWYGAATILARLSIVLLLPAYARWFSPAELGIIQGFIVFINFSYVVMAVQMISVTMRFYYEYESRGTMHELLGTLMPVLLACTIIAAAVFIYKASWVSSYLFKSSGYSKVVIIGVVGTVLWVLNDYVMALLRLRRKVTGYLSVSAVQFCSVMLLNILLVWHYKMGINGVFWAVLISNIIISALLIAVGYVPKRYKFSYAVAKRAAKYTAPMLIIPILEWFRSYYYQLYLLRYFGEAELGVVSVAIRFIQVYILVETAISLAWQPTAMSVIDHPQGKDLYKCFYRYLQAIYLVLFVLLSLFSKEIISVVATDKYSTAFRYVPILFLMPLGKALYSHYSMGITICEKTVYRTFAIASGVGITVGFIILFGKFGGQYGVMIGSGLGSLAIAIISLIFSNRHYKIGYPMSPLLATLICAAIVIIYNVSISSAQISGVEIICKTGAVAALILFIYYYWLADNERQYVRKYTCDFGSRLRVLVRGERYGRVHNEQ